MQFRYLMFKNKNKQVIYKCLSNSQFNICFFNIITKYNIQITFNSKAPVLCNKIKVIFLFTLII